MNIAELQQAQSLQILGKARTLDVDFLDFEVFSSDNAGTERDSRGGAEQGGGSVEKRAALGTKLSGYSISQQENQGCCSKSPVPQGQTAVHEAQAISKGFES